MYITSIKKPRIFLVIISLHFFLLACENVPVEFSSLSEDVVASFTSLNPSFTKKMEEVGSEEIKYQDLKEGIRWVDSPDDRSFKAGELTITLDKINILFVIDNSLSMKAEQESIANQFDSFLTSLDGQDYNIAIITTDVNENGSFKPFPNGQKWLTGAQDTSKAYLQKNIEYFQQNMVAIGIRGSWNERGLVTTKMALEKEDQKNFFRPNALLMVIIVSDEDESPPVPDKWPPNPDTPLRNYMKIHDPDTHLVEKNDNTIKTLYDKFYNLHNTDSSSYGTDPIVIHSIVGVPKGDLDWEKVKRKSFWSYTTTTRDKWYHWYQNWQKCLGSSDPIGFTQAYTYEKASQGMLLSGTDLKEQYGNIIPGQVLDICKTNYGSQLKPISEQAINNRVVSLPCVPNSKENVFILTPDGENFHPDRLEGKIIYIEKSIPFGTKINVYFTCPK